ncbi:serine/threonine-protein kinase PknG [Micromonospora pisi]|uniref:non-specific serine/threonine protein kinase n=1 Tax=Micromonospora pisi TaxID=589240 RepID=A0A495JBV5_9ACTN|nr:serine/threonine-protein kinase [Micromonospora pisi]RKR85988.1 serine/threonine-protein kinase PknG [Micromonospora pisi]
MTACVRPDCVGSYGPEGYCDECGRRAPVGNAGYVGLPPGGGAPVSDGSSASAGSTPSAAMTRGTASSSGRTGTRGTGRGRLGGGLLDVPRMPRRDPTTAVLADPQVPESRRYCATCGRPVGRSRDGRPGLVEGFCTNDRTPYSFRPALDPGTAVAGRYEVLGTLAYGGLGWIYLARDRNVGDEVSDRWVVLKGLIDSGDADATAAAITERRFLVEVDHPAIVKIYDFVSHPDPRSGDRVGYIVMEYVGGRSLRDIYLDQPVVGGARQPLPLPHVIAYGLEVLPALGYLHERGLLYCDFKPDNVLHADDRITLVDLGAVRRIDDDVSAVWGTTGYQAPEVATVGPSASSDLYTVARSMAVLSFDFRGFSTAYLDKLPGPETVPLLEREESYYRLLRRATHPDPARRFGSAAEMTEQLLGVLRQVLASDGVPRPNVSAQFTGERRAFGTRAGQVDADATAHQTRPGAASVVAGLPIPQVDPADPAAALLATVQTADPDVLAEALSTLGSTGVEARLAVVRARLVSGDVATARTELAAIERVGDDWRLDWYDGLVALAEERFGDARQAFDRVYDALPGELAPQLALAATAELVGDGETARRLYERVWRTDHAYVSAAFGLARILAGADDRAAAVAVLDTVPESSSHSVPAQIAAVRARLGAEPTRLAESELLDVSTRVERLGLGVERRAWLTVETLRAALDWVRAGNGGAGRVLSHTLSERELRFGLERAFRVLSKVAADQETRIGLVDQANSVRPRTWF